MAYFCFKKGCKFEVEYLCLCLACETYSCEFHLEEHLKLPNRNHVFDSILEDLSEWTKHAILRFLAKEKSKKEKLKKIVLATFIEYAQNHEESLRNLDSDLEQLRNLIGKISQASKQGPISNSLNLELDTDVKSEKTIFSQESEPYSSIQLFCKLHQLRKKKSEFLNRANYGIEAEEDFKRICSLYENYDFDPLISQTLQEFTNDYKRMTSLYLIDMFNPDTKMFIYDTASENEEVKALEILGEFQYFGCITQLPNGELFFISYQNSAPICFIIDRNYKFREISSGWPKKYSSAVYYDRSIYCFGGLDNDGSESNTTSRFDFDENRWVHLPPMPKADSSISCIIYNRNIVITGRYNDGLLIYSIDIDSFSQIPIDMHNYYPMKILINSGERLYLIELIFYGSVYESDIGDEYSWKQIGISMIDRYVSQVYCSYNRGGIYISTIDNKNIRQYFKFDLNKKALFEIAYYNENVALRRLGYELEVIKCPDQTFTLDSDHAQIYVNKRFPLYYLGKELNEIECLNESIKLNPNLANNYLCKGVNLYNLDRNLEAIDYFNKAIKLSPKDKMGYTAKGDSLYDMGKYIEAINCYNQAIKLSPQYLDLAWYNKACALRNLGQHLEEIECYDEIIKNHGWYAYIEKGDALRILGKTLEAIKCYDKAAICLPIKAKSLMRKGHALIDLKRRQEAMNCYNDSIYYNPDNFLSLCHRAYLLNDMGQEAEALEDFNSAYNLLNKKRNYNEEIPYLKNNVSFDEALILEILELIKRLCKLQENAIELRKELQKIKYASQNYIEVAQKINEKWATVKVKRSKLIKRAIECLNPIKNKSIEAIKQKENEINEHQKANIDIVAILRLLLRF